MLTKVLDVYLRNSQIGYAHRTELPLNTILLRYISPSPSLSLYIRLGKDCMYIVGQYHVLGKTVFAYRV